jgi:hypothetical protein
MQNSSKLFWKEYVPFMDFSRFVKEDAHPIGKWDLALSKTCLLSNTILQIAIAGFVISATAPLHPISVLWFVGAGVIAGVALGASYGAFSRGEPYDPVSDYLPYLSTLGKIAVFVRELVRPIAMNCAFLAVCFYVPYVGLLAAPTYSFYVSFVNSCFLAFTMTRTIKPLRVTAEAN